MERILRAAWTVISWPSRGVDYMLQAGDQTYASFDHLALNVSRPSTEWINMGDWSGTDEFPQACENLARLLHREAGVRPGAAVLDVGHGCGDSLLLLAREHRPGLLHGVTSVPSHAARARSRLAGQEKQLSEGRPLSWQVYCDDAVRFVERDNEPTYDFILALDCAYHFQTRQAFLNACKSKLKPGGRVALVDLVASHPYPSPTPSSFFTPSPTLPSPDEQVASLASRLKHWITTLMTSVPLGNLISIQQYHNQLCQAGFEAITIRDTSHLVFPSFARFLQQLGKGEDAPWRAGGYLQTTALRSFGSVVQGWSRGGRDGMVRSVVVVAESSKDKMA